MLTLYDLYDLLGRYGVQLKSNFSSSKFDIHLRPASCRYTRYFRHNGFSIFFWFENFLKICGLKTILCRLLAVDWSYNFIFNSRYDIDDIWYTIRVICQGQIPCWTRDCYVLFFKKNFNSVFRRIFAKI